jgi:tyrosine-protein phosphatase SIW14
MRTFERVIGVPGLSNLGVVAEGKVYRSAQPDYTKRWMYFNEGIGVNYILNLREKSEAEIVEAAGLDYFQLRLNVLSDVTVDDFDLIVQTLTNPDNHPILVHCQSGADRTGIACAAYRMAVDGWTLTEAWEELECYGGGIHNLLNIKLKYHLEQYAEAKRFQK